MGIGAAPRLSSRLNLGGMWKPALRGRHPEQAALLELLPAAARARVVAADVLVRVESRPPRRRVEGRDLELPRPVPLGPVREGVPCTATPPDLIRRRLCRGRIMQRVATLAPGTGK